MKIKKNRQISQLKLFQTHLHFTIMILRNGTQNFRDMLKKGKIIKKFWVKIMRLLV